MGKAGFSDEELDSIVNELLDGLLSLESQVELLEDNHNRHVKATELLCMALLQYLEDQKEAEAQAEEATPTRSWWEIFRW